MSILALATIGRTQIVIDDSTFTAVVVFVTTLAAPRLLKAAIRRQIQRQAAA